MSLVWAHSCGINFLRAIHNIWFIIKREECVSRLRVAGVVLWFQRMHWLLGGQYRLQYDHVTPEGVSQAMTSHPRHDQLAVMLLSSPIGN